MIHVLAGVAKNTKTVAVANTQNQTNKCVISKNARQSFTISKLLPGVFLMICSLINFECY